jgi:hypothetical protein
MSKGWKVETKRKNSNLEEKVYLFIMIFEVAQGIQSEKFWGFKLGMEY